MITDKNILMRTAAKSIDNIEDVRNACIEAKKNVYSVLQQVSNNWQSESGSAMCNALYDLYNQLNTAQNDLSTALICLKNEANAAYNCLSDLDL